MRASGEAGSPALMQTHSRSVSLASLSSTASSRPGAALLSPRAIASLVALAVHGIWQEKLLVRGQQEGAERHALSSAPLLVAVECVFCTLAAAATILLKSKGAGVARPRPLSMSIARLNVLVAACDFASKVCLYTALQYVSYTSQSLSRASHAALVVGIGRSVLSKGHATAWFAPSLVLFGWVVYGATRTPQYANFVGAALLVGAGISDHMGGYLAQSLSGEASSHRLTYWEQHLWINALVALLAAATCTSRLITPSLAQDVKLVLAHSGLQLGLLLLGASASAGLVLYPATAASATFRLAMPWRHIVSLVVNFAVFGDVTKVGPQRWLAIGWVVAGVVIGVPVPDDDPSIGDDAASEGLDEKRTFDDEEQQRLPGEGPRTRGVRAKLLAFLTPIVVVGLGWALIVAGSGRASGRLSSLANSVVGGLSDYANAHQPFYSKPQSEEERAIALARQRAIDNDIIIFGANSDYHDFLRGMTCRLDQLGITNYIVIAFNAEALVQCREEKLACACGFDATHVAGTQAAYFGGEDFKKLSKMKSRQVLRFLEAGLNVLWSDVDMFFFENPLPRLHVADYDSYDILIQSEALAQQPVENRGVNSGFYYAHAQPNVVAAFSEIVKHAAASSTTEQPSFYHVLCGGGGSTVGTTECVNAELRVSTKVLPRSRFANGGNQTLWRELSFPDSVPDGVSIIHNNWIAGHEQKAKRFRDRGMMLYDSAHNRCSI